jgi:hypothetical protein
MTPYAKIYFKHFNYATEADVICEGCLGQAVEIHHIHGRGKGKNIISNLIALCRKCHERAHSSKNYVSKSEFEYIHNNFLNGVRKVFLK